MDGRTGRSHCRSSSRSCEPSRRRRNGRRCFGTLAMPSWPAPELPRVASVARGRAEPVQGSQRSEPVEPCVSRLPASRRRFHPLAVGPFGFVLEEGAIFEVTLVLGGVVG